MVKPYGVPYLGSKNRIAEYIVFCILSKCTGERLVDAFGGGGAISDCAAQSGFFKKIVYNDFNPDVVAFVKDCFTGKAS